MTATTSPDGLKYPNDPNAAADVINDMQALATSTQTALNAHMDVAPVPTLVARESGWNADATGYGAPTLDKTGRLVIARGLFVRASDLNVTDNVAIQIGTIPVGYRPAVSLRAHGAWYGFAAGSPGFNNTSVALLSVFTGGNISWTPNFTGQIKAGQWVSIAGISWFTPA